MFKVCPSLNVRLVWFSSVGPALWLVCLSLIEFFNLFSIVFWSSSGNYSGKELSSWHFSGVGYFCAVLVKDVPFPFGVQSGMGNSNKSFPDYCPCFCGYFFLVTSLYVFDDA